MGRYHPVKKYLNGRVSSFKNAFEGLKYAVKTQKNAQIHLAATILVLIFGGAFKLTRFEWALIVFAITNVWIAEIINTAIEKAVDLCNPHFHPLAKISKDLAAAAVLIAAFGSAIIGILIFLPRIWVLILH